MSDKKQPTLQSISIVIPAYNEEHHLKACLDAIAKQTTKPNEVIVVDNNSKDKTVDIAKSYPFVRVITEKRQGVVFARDTGFNAVGSDIIGRIDADTILPKNWVAYIKKYYRNKDCHNYALTGGCYFYNVRLPFINSWYQDQIAFRFNRLLMGHYILYGSNMALPKHIWQAVKKDVCDDTDVHEDLDLAIHAHTRGYQITYHAGFKVGVKMRRVRSNHKELWHNLMWWPKTLKRHGKWTWVLGFMGAIFLYLSAPVVVAAEYIARAFGRPALDE